VSEWVSEYCETQYEETKTMGAVKVDSCRAMLNSKARAVGGYVE